MSASGSSADKTEEELKKQSRAERFGMSKPIDTSDELEKKRKRAERFGVGSGGANTSLEVSNRIIINNSMPSKRLKE